MLNYEVLLRVALGFGLHRGWMGLDYDADTKSLLLSPDGGKAWFTYEAGTKWKCYDYGARRMSDREFAGPPECV